MSDGPNGELPDLPDLNDLVGWAVARRDHFAEIVKEAQAEVSKAQAYLDALKPLKTRRSPGVAPLEAVPEATIKQVLATLSNHQYAGVSTLSGGSGFSPTHVGKAMRHAEKRGLVTVARYGRKIRYSITEDGVEFLTCPDGKP